MDPAWGAVLLPSVRKTVAHFIADTLGCAVCEAAGVVEDPSGVAPPSASGSHSSNALSWEHAEGVQE